MTIGYEQTYQLRTDDFDRYSRLQPASVLDVFQDVAGVSAELTPGMTWREITDAGLVWVVTRIKYEVLD
ncbi:MAG: thioesterase, partial [Eggerthellaceae bacterium]